MLPLAQVPYKNECWIFASLLVFGQKTSVFLSCILTISLWSNFSIWGRTWTVSERWIFHVEALPLGDAGAFCPLALWGWIVVGKFTTPSLPLLSAARMYWIWTINYWLASFSDTVMLPLAWVGKKENFLTLHVDNIREVTDAGLLIFFFWERIWKHNC